eukprot:scaffold8071_cov116-Isochrysis_galbana.AAC.3
MGGIARLPAAPTPPVLNTSRLERHRLRPFPCPSAAPTAASQEAIERQQLRGDFWQSVLRNLAAALSMVFVAWLLCSRVRQLRGAQLGRSAPKLAGGYRAPDKADVARASGKESNGVTEADPLASTPGRPVGTHHLSCPGLFKAVPGLFTAVLGLRANRPWAGSESSPPQAAWGDSSTAADNPSVPPTTPRTPFPA